MRNNRRSARTIWSAALVSCLGVVGLLGGVALQAPPAEAASSLWSITPSPNSGTYNNILNGVSCTSSTSCVAVGYYINVGPMPPSVATLIETWDGSAWTIIPSPNPSIYEDFLYGVSCTSSTSCVAVGDQGAAEGGEGVDQTLIETWDGTAWTTIPSPSESDIDNFLKGVSCTSSTSCVAVGSVQELGYPGTFTLVETWDGSAWTITPSPNASSYENSLNGVSCTSSTSCVAVGSYDEAGQSVQTLIETWDGTAWSITSSPNASTSDNYLSGVSCTSSTRCVAAGRLQAVGGSEAGTLVETWDGSAWTITPSPNTGVGGISLSGLSCTSSTSCVAVGSYDKGSKHKVRDRTLIESWDGTAWTITPSPNAPHGYVKDVSCASATSCMAAGFQGVPTAYKTLTMTGPAEPPPTITSFKPNSGKVGTKVTVAGRSLFGAISVTFNGVGAVITKDTANKIKAKVPNGATTGYIQVTTGWGTATSPKVFTVR